MCGDGQMCPTLVELEGAVVSDRAYLKGTGNADNCRTGRVWSLLQRAVGGSMRRTEAS